MKELALVAVFVGASWLAIRFQSFGGELPPACATAEGPPDCSGMADDAGHERHPTSEFDPDSGCYACLTDAEEAADRQISDFTAELHH